MAGPCLHGWLQFRSPRGSVGDKHQAVLFDIVFPLFPVEWKGFSGASAVAPDLPESREGDFFFFFAFL